MNDPLDYDDEFDARIGVEPQYAEKGDYTSGFALRGKKDVYRKPVSKGVTNRVRKLNHTSALSAVSPFASMGRASRPPLADREVTMEQVHSRTKKDSPTAISLFTGAGGVYTGFAMSGWRNLSAAEFVHNACETLDANYEMRIIWPTEVLIAATQAAKELGIAVAEPVPRVPEDLSAFASMEPALVVVKPSKRYKQNIGSSVEWEATMFRCGLELFRELRERTNRIIYDGLGEHNPDVSYLWGDDIRAMSGTEMLRFMNIAVGEVDCLYGEPPCASFSIVGSRLEGWGKQHKYSEERIQSTRNLFDEYVRLVGEIKPKMLLAENVTGLNSGDEPKKYISDIITALHDKGYNCQTRDLNSCDHESVQSRVRLFIQGVRSDLRIEKTGRQARPAWPVKSKHRYMLRDALEVAADRNTDEQIEAVQLGDREIGRTWDILEVGATPENKQFATYKAHPDAHCPTLTVAGVRDLSAAGVLHPTERRKFTVPEIAVIFGFPKDFTFLGQREQASERLARDVPTPLAYAISVAMRKNLANCTWDTDITADTSVI